MAETGFAKTFVERPGPTPVNALSNAQHTFLRLRQPIDEATLPQPRVIEVGRTYRFPFTFVVPERLLPGACRHPCDSDPLHEAHLQLPPSMGDPTVAGDGNALLDDMAPVMSRITYAIKATLSRTRESDGQDVVLGEGLKRLRVLPASEELAPLDIDGTGDDYILRRHKDIKKGIFKGRLGGLAVEAAQPKSLQLPPPGSLASGLTSTMATVVLRFDPATEATLPPRLGQLVARLKVRTHFSTEPMKGFPRDDRTSLAYVTGRTGSFSETVQLSSRCVESAQWEPRGAEDNNLRRDSNLSVSSSSLTAPVLAPTPKYAGGIFYTAKVLVPVTLPKGKMFIPTFHSCLISRLYTLELSLTASTPNASMSASTLTLRLPLQISSTGNMTVPPRSPTLGQWAEAEAEAEADSYLQPRIISPPADAFVATSDLSPGRAERNPPSSTALRHGSPNDPADPTSITTSANPSFPSSSSVAPPPGYSFFSGASQGVAMRIPSPLGISPVCG